MGVMFEKKPDLNEGECRATEVMLVSSLPGGIEISPPSTMTCPTAEALARWTLEHVAPEAERHLKATARSVRIGTSYQCRTQRSGAKLSEHAFANALDIMGFTFVGRQALAVAPQPDGSPEAAFQSAIRAGACGLFTTVLGPGADEDHGDHLHLDLRGRKGNFRICQ